MTQNFYPHFGRIEPNQEQINLHDSMNRQLLNLCKKLPRPLQNSAAIFLRQYNPTDNFMFDFMSLFYPPSYSILYWISNFSIRDEIHTRQNREFGSKAMSMALFLHLLDDHIADGDIRVDHMHLQLRTEAWNVYMENLEYLGNQVPNGKEIIREYIEEYFDNIYDPPAIQTIDE